MAPTSMNWLSTQDLQTFIATHADSRTKAAFLGVFSIDCLPSPLFLDKQLPLLLIINTNTHNLPGEHWKAVYVSVDHEGEVFDSLAMPVSIVLQRWMNIATWKWLMTPVTIQNPLSPYCGAYVLYFVMSRLRYKSLDACIARFRNNTVVQNDVIVKQAFSRKFVN